VETHSASAVGEPDRDLPRLVVPDLTSGASCDSKSLLEATERPRTVDGLKPRRGARPSKYIGSMLILWAVLIIDFQGLLWLSGVKTLALQQAMEQGVARAESRAVGEMGDSQIHKAIQDQRATLRFWTTLALIGDFVVEPLAPAVRALLVATLLAALAALAGRPIGFRLALEECAAVQGYWVLGLALQTALVFILRTPDVDVSMALLLPAGTYRAAPWIALSQADAFALLGWAALIRGGWCRGQANLATATAACSAAAAVEAMIRIGFTLITGAAMRLMLMPGRF
jgi:hypothetical protein